MPVPDWPEIGGKMRKEKLLRPLRSVMNDSYSIKELYSVFEDQVFSKAKKIDISLLNETVRALDEHSDEEAAPHQNRVWLQVSSKVQAQQPVVLGLTRHAIAILIIILTILLAGVAIGVIDWTAVFQSTYHDTERQETSVESWSLNQKKDIVAALKTAGYDVSSLPALNGKTDVEQDQILTEWINKQTDGEVNDWLFNVLTRLKGLFDSWSLEDKAWYCQLLVENQLVLNGDFVSSYPPYYRQEDIDKIITWAWNMAHERYDDTAAELDTWTPYIFYGYVYPDEKVFYWRVHFRGEENENVFTVQIESTEELNYKNMTIVMDYDVPEDVG